jgi:hypothetical protein
MLLASRQVIVLRILAGVVAILALGLWCRYEFLVKPIKVQRASRLAYYKDFAQGLRRWARDDQFWESSPDGPARRRRLSSWVEWFDGRVQSLEKASSYRRENENRIYQAFQSTNPDFEPWLERIGRVL